MTKGTESLIPPVRTDEMPQFVTRFCPYCDGAGATAGCAGPIPCEECDGTGSKYRAVWTTDDGLICSMTGSGRTPPDANTRAAMEMVARAVQDATQRTKGGDEAHRPCVTGVSAATRGADAVRASDPPTSDRARTDRVASDPGVRHREHDGTGDDTGNVPNAGGTS